MLYIINMRRVRPTIKDPFLTQTTIFMILVFAFIALLPMLIDRDFTPSNELRYLSIADEAISKGHIFAFTSHGAPYADKPPLFIWIVMLGRFLFGSHSMFFLSLFSLIPAFIIAIIMDSWCAPHLHIKMRSSALMMLLSTAMFIGSAIVIRMDMLMAMFIIIALRIFYSMEEEGKNRKLYSWLFPFLVFMAIFSKGPIGLLIPLFSTIVYLIVTKRANHIKIYWGLKSWAVLLILTSIWFINVYIEGGKDFIYNQFFHQTVGRAVNSFHHDKLFYFYLISFWYSLAPWSILIFFSIIYRVRSKVKYIPIEKFFITIVVTSFLLLSLISSKLDIYMLPLFPFLIYMSALWMDKVNFKIKSLSLLIPSILFLVDIVANLYMLKKNHSLMFGLTLPASIVLSITGLISITYLWKRKILLAISTLFLGTYIAIFFLGLKISFINRYIGYKDICEEINYFKNKYDVDGKIYVYKVKKAENMDVYLNDEIISLNEPLYKVLQNKAMIVLPSDKLPNSLPSGTIIFKNDPFAIIIKR